MTTVLQTITTQLGKNAIQNADSGGFTINLTEIAVGTGKYTPTGNEIALQAQQERVAITRKVAINPEQVYVEAVFQSASGYWINELGIYLDDGTLCYIYSHPVNTFGYKSSSSEAVNFKLTVGFSLVLTDAPPGTFNVIVAPIDDSLLLTAATTDSLGLVRLANTTDIVNQSTTAVMTAEKVFVEVSTAVTAEQMARDNSIQLAIDGEVTNRDIAITNGLNAEGATRTTEIDAVISGEVISRNNAITNAMNSAGNVVGEIKMISDLSILANNFLIADGSLVRRDMYPLLFTAIGHRYENYVWSQQPYPYPPNWSVLTLLYIPQLKVFCFSTSRNEANNTERFYVSIDDGEIWFEPDGFKSLYSGTSHGNALSSTAWNGSQFVGYSSVSHRIVGSDTMDSYYKLPSPSVDNATIIYSTFSNLWLIVGNVGGVGRIESFSPADRLTTKGNCDALSTNITFSNIKAVAASDSGRLMLFTSPGNTSLKIYSSDDGGFTWVERYQSATSGYFNAACFGANTGVAVGSNGRIHVSFDDGLDWSLMLLPGGVNDLLTNVIYTGSLFVATSSTGKLYSYYPGGQWQLLNSLGTYLSTLCSNDEGKLIVAKNSTDEFHHAVGVYDKNIYFQLPDFVQGNNELIYTVRAS